MTVMTTREQQRAALSAELIKAVKPQSAQKRYNSLVNGLPAMVRRSGLLQAVGFLEAKAAGEDRNNKPEWMLREHLRRHLVQGGFLKEDDDLMGILSTMAYIKYARAQQEATAGLGWLRRFARSAFGPVEEE